MERGIPHPLVLVLANVKEEERDERRSRNATATEERRADVQSSMCACII